VLPIINCKPRTYYSWVALFKHFATYPIVLGITRLGVQILNKPRVAALWCWIFAWYFETLLHLLLSKTFKGGFYRWW